MENHDIWKNLKKTRQRMQVYQILSETERPLGAADIFQMIQEREGDCGYAVSTVYRILQAFEQQGFVTKTSLPDSDTMLYEWNHGLHMHYAICLKCHKRIPLPECPFAHMEIPEKGFEVTGHKIEVYGYCGNCKES